MHPRYIVIDDKNERFPLSLTLRCMASQLCSLVRRPQKKQNTMKNTQSNVTDSDALKTTQNYVSDSDTVKSTENVGAKDATITADITTVKITDDTPPLAASSTHIKHYSSKLIVKNYTSKSTGYKLNVKNYRSKNYMPKITRQ